MGRIRAFWCWLASWTLWPMARGFLLFIAIAIFLIIIKWVIETGIAVVLR